MGCDIHIYVEKKNENGEWEVIKSRSGYYDDYMEMAKYCDEPERKQHLLSVAKSYENKIVSEGWVYNGRNYRLFSLLADVRNGIKGSYYNREEPETGHYIKPIDKPRGVPKDASIAVKDEYEDWSGDSHSASHFTLQELLNYDMTTPVKYQYLVSKDGYQEYLNDGCPNSWSGGASGRKISNQEMQDWIDGKISFDTNFIHTLLKWELPISHECSLDCITKGLKELSLNPEDVRIVFWFDN